jgi:hypothetical protein
MPSWQAQGQLYLLHLPYNWVKQFSFLFHEIFIRTEDILKRNSGSS